MTILYLEALASIATVALDCDGFYLKNGNGARRIVGRRAEDSLKNFDSGSDETEPYCATSVAKARLSIVLPRDGRLGRRQQMRRQSSERAPGCGLRDSGSVSPRGGHTIHNNPVISGNRLLFQGDSGV
jgi:hypothetical protein